MGEDKLLDFQLGSIDFGDRIIILEEPITLELSKAEYGEYLMVNNDFGILSMGNSLDKMVQDINEQFRVLWDEYVGWDENLTASGQMLKDKMVDRFVLHGHEFGEDRNKKKAETNVKSKKNLSEIAILWVCITSIFLFIATIVSCYEHATQGIFGDHKLSTFLIGEIIYPNKPGWYTWVRLVTIPTITTVVLVIINYLTNMWFEEEKSE